MGRGRGLFLGLVLAWDIPTSYPDIGGLVGVVIMVAVEGGRGQVLNACRCSTNSLLNVNLPCEILV